MSEKKSQIRAQFTRLRGYLSNLGLPRRESGNKNYDVRKAPCRQVIQMSVVIGCGGFGLFLLLLALSLTEWFVVPTPNPNIKGHVGFFRRCVHDESQGTVECANWVMSENSSPICMFSFTLFSGIAACAVGFHSLFSDAPNFKSNINNVYKRIRIFLAISATSSVVGMLVTTYLYNKFLSPIGSCYVLAWLSCISFIAGCALSFFFAQKLQPNTVSTISPIKQKQRTADPESAEETKARSVPSSRRTSFNKPNRASFIRTNSNNQQQLHGNRTPTQTT